MVFSGDFRQHIGPNTIPSTVTSIFFRGQRVPTFQEHSIPTSVTHVEFRGQFIQPLEIGHIPHSVTSLSFASEAHWPQGQPGILPDSIRTLSLHVNDPVYPGMIPHSVTKLMLGEYYNQPLEANVIPSSVTYLSLGGHFNHPVLPGQIPSSVIKLRFGYAFNKELTPGAIPTSVIKLLYGHQFNQKLHTKQSLFRALRSIGKGGSMSETHLIPSSVTKLAFGYKFNQVIEPGDLPSTLTSLSFGSVFSQPLIPGSIPAAIKEVSFGKSLSIPIAMESFPTTGWLRIRVPATHKHPIVPMAGQSIHLLITLDYSDTLGKVLIDSITNHSIPSCTLIVLRDSTMSIIQIRSYFKDHMFVVADSVRMGFIHHSELFQLLTRLVSRASHESLRCIYDPLF
ncbi:hypothetical protein SAMD00019534_105720 [Acytostelium subglobosum LB1]|uniref:hypothetical protein n=1 Tax=Acytostelium subglobosum LB1 TaxID=1410327 RepID=UPI0006448E3C|nr:hypothetical protein SAMD00019534_105720 [Acytostelium subglobosum LB1]GAM27397.1 hypothetical protein SAMD00019534_105720 [Acytostelium subglobosum LB1]|eukprot:XP_012749462.1 hypothetical protein SAMD00019534_105720 [Acytostelium subglobosum LB1]